MPNADTSLQTRGYADLVIGCVVSAIGIFALITATGFDAMSRSYPIALGGILTVLGVALAIKARLGTGQQAVELPASVMPKLLGGIVLIALWVAAITGGLGFLIPTLVMQIAFIWTCGVRSGKTLWIAPILISGVSFVVFVVLLDVPITSLLSNWTGG